MRMRVPSSGRVRRPRRIRSILRIRPLSGFPDPKWYTILHDVPPADPDARHRRSGGGAHRGAAARRVQLHGTRGHSDRHRHVARDREPLLHRTENRGRDDRPELPPVRRRVGRRRRRRPRRHRRRRRPRGARRGRDDAAHRRHQGQPGRGRARAHRRRRRRERQGRHRRLGLPVRGSARAR
ncbi:hypothetical protein MICRO8M_20182 [Microbacterium sp. 8M]|nr:hypothetical protein MICRO8M_20182 [Microbacterium sp. 8M]